MRILPFALLLGFGLAACGSCERGAPGGRDGGSPRASGAAALLAFAARLEGLDERLPLVTYALVEEPCPQEVIGARLPFLDVEAARSLAALRGRGPGTAAWPELSPAFAPVLRQRGGAESADAARELTFLDDARLVAVLRPTQWRLPEVLADGTALPGALLGWLFVVDLEGGAVLCQAAVDVDLQAEPAAASGAPLEQLLASVHAAARDALARVAHGARLAL